MMRRLGAVMFAGAMLVAATAAAPVFSASGPASSARAEASGKALFMKPVALRGMLGDVQIQVTLRTKEPAEDGIEGEYFVFGKSHRVLLAGEIEGQEVFMEESENGTDVSGQWDGKLAGETLSGEWQSPDGQVKKPFSLRIVRADEKNSPGQNARPSGQDKQQ
jgi:hypothetical protein